MRTLRACGVLLIVAPLACGEAGQEVALMSRQTDAAVVASEALAPTALPAADAVAQSMWTEQKLIRTADLEVEVDSARGALEEAERIATAHDGLVADSRITKDVRGKEHATVSLRVPTPRFVETLAQLRRLGSVEREAVHTEDVTKAYADLETRLAVKEETAARLRRLLSSQTGDLSDVLEVERELGRVTAEIELLKGERRYYDQRVAYSTINLTLMEPGALASSGIGTPIAEAFRQAVEVLSTSVAWLIYLVVFLAPWLAVAGLGWWGVRRVRRARRAD
ncbi:MAG: DUF4349 domain-containing protein [Gemmatimonadota bacterium]|nr:DUF4349 domain-containing protein [Gemmatimonadota bacterium]